MDSKATQSYTYVRPFSPKPLPSVLPLSVERRPLRFGVGPCSVSPGLNFVDERVSVVSTSAARGLRCRARAALWLGARTARRGGFSRRRARARRARRAPSLRPAGSVAGSRTSERRLGGCGRGSVTLSRWCLPGPGVQTKCPLHREAGS